MQFSLMKADLLEMIGRRNNTKRQKYKSNVTKEYTPLKFY